MSNQECPTMPWQLLQHGHEPRVIEVEKGVWQIVLTLDGNYFNRKTAMQVLLYWQEVVLLCHQENGVTRQGRL